MHKKDNSKSHNYVQGLKPFSSSIPKTLKKYLKKGGYNYSNIVDNWTKMVSKKISDACYPAAIKIDKNMKNGNLILNVLHGKELEIEYEKNEIKDKINSFFGYECIKQVTLKIVQQKIQNKYKYPKIKNSSEINKKMDKITNSQLKDSLNNFIQAFNARNK